MSFASNVKAEICKAQLSKKCCALAECYGILLYCNTFSADQIKIVTESPEFAARLQRVFRKAFGFGFDSVSEPVGKMSFVISAPEKLEYIFQCFGFQRSNCITLHVNFGVLENSCCRAAFLLGAFLAGGSVTDPEKRYHLEFATGHIKVGAETCALMQDMGLSAKQTVRGGSCILYFKQSERIADFLTFLGAPVCAMKVMEAKVEKDLRNGVNRRVNCETANLTKVVDAAQDQIAAIRKLQAGGVLDTLPDKLRQAAKLRCENPEATLTELAEMSVPPTSKSAINHRMRKLLELSRE